MKTEKDKDNIMINIYAILAIVLVIIPEKLAEGIIYLTGYKNTSNLNLKSVEWDKNTQLRISSLNLRDLRQIAKEHNIWGYSSDSRSILEKRMIRVILWKDWLKRKRKVLLKKRI